MRPIACEDVRLPDGRAAACWRLDAPGGIAVTLSTLGATLLAIEAPDRAGRRGAVLAGPGDPRRLPAGGAPGSHHYPGATCGRFANRIAHARFRLDGAEHRVAANQPPHHLHGGFAGFDRRIWDVEPLADGVAFHLVSPDGDQGFPGRLEVTARFRLLDPYRLSIAYRAVSDRPTHVNLASHGYFNLASGAGGGEGAVGSHRLRVAASRYLPIAPDGIPLGPPAPVEGTPFDFRAARALAPGLASDDPQIIAGDGYNHCLLLDAPGLERPVARLHDPASGRVLTLATTAPGLQLYSGNALDGTGGLGPRRSAFALEAQHWPDSPNRPDYPSTRLDPGGCYVSETILGFEIAD